MSKFESLNNTALVADTSVVEIEMSKYHITQPGLNSGQSNNLQLKKQLIIVEFALKSIQSKDVDQETDGDCSSHVSLWSVSPM